MFPQQIERLLRRRVVYPLLFSAAILILVVNETTYRHSIATLGGGIALTDARISAARALQLITDAESAQRGYVLTGQEAYIKHYQQALAELPGVMAPTLRFVAGDNTDGESGDARLRRLVDARLAELVTTIALYRQGKGDEARAAVEADIGRNRMDRLRATFNDTLKRGAATQQQARVSLYEALGLNRWVVLVLTIGGAAAAFVFLRQLHANDEGRERSKLSLEADVQARTTELRQLAGYLETAREDERSHVARELHDELGGMLTAVKLELLRLRRVADLPAPALERVASIERRVDDGIALKRRIIEDLRPSALDQLGLRESLLMLCNDAAGGLGVPVAADLEPLALGHDVELTIYRLVQESLTNIRKYAEASKVTVSLRHSAQVVSGAMPHTTAHTTAQTMIQVQVQDDGVGFDASAKSVGRHGLSGMRYRVESHGGTMQVITAPGQGTTVQAQLPVPASVPASMSVPAVSATSGVSGAAIAP